MRLVFMGTPESAVSTLRRCLQDGHDVVAVWTQPDRPAGRGNKVSASPVKEFALSRGLTVQQPSKIKTEEAAELFRSHEADVAVVVAYGRILPKAFLAAPKQGCVNVHFSLLPKYRGAAPVNWAIVNGESDTGVTTMMVEPELDSGPILLQRSTAIDATETAPQVMQRLAEMGADLLSETLRDFGKVRAREQDHAQASFAPILKKEDGLIKWSSTATSIDRAIRGFQPWPNAYTAYQSRGLTVFRAEIGSATNEVAAPGQVLAARGDDLIVACGEQSTLRILELQPEARRRIGVRDFLNGVQVKVGDRLG